MKTSQKFLGFSYVATLSSTVQRINSKSCFIWQVCQSWYKFSCLPLYLFQGINILCQVYGHQSWTQYYSRCGLTYVLYKKINSSLEILKNVLLSIPKIFVAQVVALSQWKENFKDDVVQIPRSFPTSTSFRFNTDLMVVVISIVQLLL